MINFSGKDFYIFGDSITNGVGASDSAHRYSTLLCQMLGATEHNFGIDSSTLQKRTPVNPLVPGINMLDRLGDIPTKVGSIAALMFFFGMNDWGVNSVSSCSSTDYCPANYVSDYQTVINACTAKGWSASEIIILSPSYPLDQAFTFYGGINGGRGNPTRAAMLNYQDAALSVANTNSTLFLNMYNAMLGSGNVTSLVKSTDGVHPNDDGHSFLAMTIFSFLTASIAKQSGSAMMLNNIFVSL
jgi:lysophospholipase L1-like esterase